jgi:hypothetical protein
MFVQAFRIFSEVAAGLVGYGSARSRIGPSQCGRLGISSKQSRGLPTIARAQPRLVNDDSKTGRKAAAAYARPERRWQVSSIQICRLPEV